MGFFMNKDGDIKIGSIVFSAVVAVAAVATLISACEEVPTGHTGVQVVMGSVQTETLDPGFHLKTPFVCDVVEVDNKIQKIEVDASEVVEHLGKLLTCTICDTPMGAIKEFESQVNTLCWNKCLTDCMKSYYRGSDNVCRDMFLYTEGDDGIVSLCRVSIVLAGEY